MQTIRAFNAEKIMKQGRVTKQVCNQFVTDAVAADDETDGHDALLAEQNGFATHEETVAFLKTLSEPVTIKRSVMSFAGTGHGLWGKTAEEIETHTAQIHSTWERDKNT